MKCGALQSASLSTSMISPELTAVGRSTYNKDPRLHSERELIAHFRFVGKQYWSICGSFSVHLFGLYLPPPKVGPLSQKLCSLSKIFQETMQKLFAQWLSSSAELTTGILSLISGKCTVIKKTKPDKMPSSQYYKVQYEQYVSNRQ